MLGIKQLLVELHGRGQTSVSQIVWTPRWLVSRGEDGGSSRVEDEEDRWGGIAVRRRETNLLLRVFKRAQPRVHGVVCVQMLRSRADPNIEQRDKLLCNMRPPRV